MKKIPLLLCYILLALSLLFLGFFIVYKGGDPGVGSATVMWLLSVAVVVVLIVPKLAPLLHHSQKKTK